MTKQRIFVAGHRGMVGSAIVRQLEQRGDVEVIVRTRDELNLLDSLAVQDFFASERIDQVYLAAAKVGGIVANNTYPADFIYENMMIESNIIHAAHLYNVNKLLFLGSSCIYPKMAKQPIAESELLQGTLEATNEPYAIAKIAGIKLCESYNRQYNRDYRSVMPTNLYGPHDNFHPSNSHVIPALLRRFHEATAENAPDVVVWGSGTPMREFLHVDDMAAASIHVMELDREVWQENTEPMLSHINVGTGVDCTIRELAQTIAQVVGYKGRVVFDATKPMFLSQEDFATVVRSTPLISIDLIVENERGEFLLGKRTNRPAQGFWFVPGGRVQKDETLTDAFERLTLAELDLQLPMAAGQFYGVWQHFYDDNFSGTGFTTHYIVLGFRLKVSEADLRLPDSQHDDYRWLTPEALLASDNVHDNSRAYFLAERQAEVPGL